MSPAKKPDIKKTTDKIADEAPQKDQKGTSSIHWKSLGMGILAGILVFWVLTSVLGARLSELNLGILKFSLPQATQTAGALTPNSDPLLGVALTGLKYMAGGWDPRNIDLTSAATDGIYVPDGYSLRLFDLWVTAPPGVSGYKGQFEVYAKGNVIGRSGLLELQPGGTLFEEIIPTGYQHPDAGNAWKYQADWDQLDLALIIYHQDQPAGGAVTQIRINNTGRAWFITPPYTHIVSIVYRVNDGPKMVLDLRAVQDANIEVKPGDSLTIDEVWYRADDTLKDRSMQVEIYLSAGTYDSETSRQSHWVTFEQGNHDLLVDNPLTWEAISADRKYLIITLERDDQTVLDRYVLTLDSGEASALH